MWKLKIFHRVDWRPPGSFLCPAHPWSKSLWSSDKFLRSSSQRSQPATLLTLGRMEETPACLLRWSPGWYPWFYPQLHQHLLCFHICNFWICRETQQIEINVGTYSLPIFINDLYHQRRDGGCFWDGSPFQNASHQQEVQPKIWIFISLLLCFFFYISMSYK